VIFVIDCDPADLAHDPIVGQLLWPLGVVFSRRLMDPQMATATMTGANPSFLGIYNSATSGDKSGWRFRSRFSAAQRGEVR